MRVALIAVVLGIILALQMTYGWSDDEYAKIRVAVAKNPDLTTTLGALLNCSSKAADTAMFYRLQGNSDLADLWLAVAWQEYQQSQTPEATVPKP